MKNLFFGRSKTKRDKNTDEEERFRKELEKE